MKAAFVLAAAGAAVAQNFAGEPRCAISCLTSAIQAVGCALTDQACQCNSATQSALASAGGLCLLSACNSTELQQAITAGSQLCAAYSATAAPTATAANGTAVATAIAISNSTSTITSAATMATTGSASKTTSKTASGTTASASASSTSSSGAGANQAAMLVGAGAWAAVIGLVAAL